MISFIVFWSTLCFHIWHPSTYIPENLIFWNSPPSQELAAPNNFTQHTVFVHIDFDKNV